MSAAAEDAEHGTLMDAIYRRQRHIYDATRKYYLFGRDRLIRELGCNRGDTVLELGCGTGRNLDRIDEYWPNLRLYGLDISAEMLKSAAARLGPRARLAVGDATSFDPKALFGRTEFDRVVISFALSMIPDWERALHHAVSLLSPRGSLHVVDFGGMERLPSPFRTGLKAWLRKFHVTPRTGLVMHAESVAARHAMRCYAVNGFGNYYTLLKIERES